MGTWKILGSAALLALALLHAPGGARAEYRAYELEVYNLFDCRVNKREKCQKAVILTALDPKQYLLTHGGGYHVGVLMLATWRCWGDTSFYRTVCPRPAPKNGRFQPGQQVQIQLDKHITDGWQGKVEVAYYQEGVRSNVYGVRFEGRRDVYARYFEKDLKAAGAAPTTPQGGGQGAQPATGQPTDTTQPAAGADTAQPAAAPPAAQPGTGQPAAQPPPPGGGQGAPAQ